MRPDGSVLEMYDHEGTLKAVLYVVGGRGVAEGPEAEFYLSIAPPIVGRRGGEWWLRAIGGSFDGNPYVYARYLPGTAPIGRGGPLLFLDDVARRRGRRPGRCGQLTLHLASDPPKPGGEADAGRPGSQLTLHLASDPSARGGPESGDERLGDDWIPPE